MTQQTTTSEKVYAVAGQGVVPDGQDRAGEGGDGSA